MRILVGCEESQAVTIELRKLGHEAYSCDIQKCSGNHPEWHSNIGVFESIKGGELKTEAGETVFINNWDMGIFFPDCTYLTVSANKWYKDQPPRASGTLVGAERRQAREEAVDFFMKLYNCDIPKVAIENPIGIMSTRFRKPDQVIQPWQFSHGESKATCLWLKNLPKLIPSDIVEGREQRIHLMSPSKDRAKLRSKTYKGVAEQIAIQWAGKIEEDEEIT